MRRDRTRLTTGQLKSPQIGLLCRKAGSSALMSCHFCAGVRRVWRGTWWMTAMPEPKVTLSPCLPSLALPPTSRCCCRRPFLAMVQLSRSFDMTRCAVWIGVLDCGRLRGMIRGRAEGRYAAIRLLDYVLREARVSIGSGRGEL